MRWLPFPGVSILFCHRRKQEKGGQENNQSALAGPGRAPTTRSHQEKLQPGLCFSPLSFSQPLPLDGRGRRWEGRGHGYTTLTHTRPSPRPCTHGFTTHWEELAASRPSWTRINLPYLVTDLRFCPVSLYSMPLSRLSFPSPSPRPPRHDKDDQALFLLLA